MRPDHPDAHHLPAEPGRSRQRDRARPGHRHRPAERRTTRSGTSRSSTACSGRTASRSPAPTSSTGSSAASPSLIIGGPPYARDLPRRHATPTRARWSAATTAARASSRSSASTNATSCSPAPADRRLRLHRGHVDVRAGAGKRTPRSDYDKHPYSNGPVQARDNDRQGPDAGPERVLDRSNDQVRKAYPDKIVFDFRPDDLRPVTNELIEDQGDARNTIMLDSNVAPNFLQQVVNDPDLLSQAVRARPARSGPRDQHRRHQGRRLPPGADLRVQQA